MLIPTLFRIPVVLSHVTADSRLGDSMRLEGLELGTVCVIITKKQLLLLRVEEPFSSSFVLCAIRPGACYDQKSEGVLNDFAREACSQ